MSTTAFLDKLDYRQLQFCRDECDRRIKAIQEEEKKVAWAVTDRGLIFGWFRTEDYLKAVELLARKAAERWERADKENPELQKFYLSITSFMQDTERVKSLIRYRDFAWFMRLLCGGSNTEP